MNRSFRFYWKYLWKFLVYRYIFLDSKSFGTKKNGIPKCLNPHISIRPIFIGPFDPLITARKRILVEGSWGYYIPPKVAPCSLSIYNTACVILNECCHPLLRYPNPRGHGAAGAMQFVERTLALCIYVFIRHFRSTRYNIGIGYV